VAGRVPADDKFTIDELARRVGLTSRTIRSYQDRGLLPPPEIIGRTGYYNSSHTSRLAMIARLLDQRFSLASISTLFEAWDSGQSLAEILGIVEDIAGPLDSEKHEMLTVAEIEEHFPRGHPEWLDRAVGIGILGAINAESYEVMSPKLLSAGEKLVGAGVPVEAMLDEGERLRADCDRIAARFVDMFVQYVWTPFSDAGRPPDELERVVDYLAVTRPLPVEATSVMIAQSMQRRFENLLADFDHTVASKTEGTPP
jgi:DNA-binding transcriptional MerR regulator